MLVNGLLACLHFIRTRHRPGPSCVLWVWVWRHAEAGRPVASSLPRASPPVQPASPPPGFLSPDPPGVCSDGRWLVSSPPSITVEAGRTGLSSPRGPQPRREGRLIGTCPTIGRGRQRSEGGEAGRGPRWHFAGSVGMRPCEPRPSLPLAGELGVPEASLGF
uniref:Uncharacterized protein n=1 Tax=Myotis myotis TaxID=51298 RepID=A0A7J7SCP8_MYOMY|nr:hypothetical protein mMyoMyo1_009555 [Myotis myotis]